MKNKLQLSTLAENFAIFLLCLRVQRMISSLKDCFVMNFFYFYKTIAHAHATVLFGLFVLLENESS